MAEQDTYDKIGRAFHISGPKLYKARALHPDERVDGLAFLVEAAKKIGLTPLDIERVLGDPKAEDTLHTMRNNAPYKHQQTDYEESGFEPSFTRDILPALMYRLQEENKK